MVFGYGTAIEDAMKLVKAIESRGYTVDQIITYICDQMDKQKEEDEQYWRNITVCNPQLEIETVDFDSITYKEEQLKGNEP